MGLSSSRGGSKMADGVEVSFKDANNPLALLKGSSLAMLANKDKMHLTSSVSTPKLSSSISITPTSFNKYSSDLKGDLHSPNKGSHSSNKEGGSKPGLVKSADLPPGISLPPGIELYRPTDSAKVDKWLEQHQDLLVESKSAGKESKRRKIDFTSLDWSQFSGDEHVPVINTSTGQRLNSSEAPKLKHLAQWLMEHPSYDVDPLWAEGKKEGASLGTGSISDLQKRLLAGEKKGSSSRSHSHSSPSSSNAASGSNKSNLDLRNLLQGLDLKNPMTLAALSQLDPKLFANLDPKLLLGNIDPKLLNLDPKALAAMGFDTKLMGLDKYDHKSEKKSSSAASPSSKSSSSEPKASTSHGIDPKLFPGIDPKVLKSIDPKLLGLDPKLLGLDPKSLGLDPKLFAGLDPKSLGGIDPKLLGFDPKQLMGGLDPKLLGGLDSKLLSSLGVGLDPKALAGLDPKFFAGMGGMDPMMMMAGFGGLPGMAGLGLANPLLASLPGFNLPGMPNLSGSSKAKESQRNVAAAAAAAVAANHFSGMFGGAGAAAA
ncbi:UNVERIFIED_CONTAM: hypothetical protein GTU68_040056, partial [Idotea baltica]|nr:hypothetical protein [Idotea baltica]